MLIVGIASMAIAAVAAVAAIVQARAAHASQIAAEDARNESRVARDEAVRLSAEANEAFKRQAVAQERANELAEMKSRPPSWTGPRRVKGDIQGIGNTSGKVIVVESVEVRPEGADNFVTVDREFPHSFQPGDELRFTTFSSIGGSADDMILHWRFADSAEYHRTVVNF